jgi:ABC-type amino acid transport substrate-binding protein
MSARRVAIGLALAALLSGCATDDVSDADSGPALLACVVPTVASVERAPTEPLGWRGYDIELLAHVAAELEDTLVLVETSLDDALAGLPTATERCEVVAGALPDDGSVLAPLVASPAYREQQLVVVGEGVWPTATTAPLGHVRDPAVRAVAERVAGEVLAYPSSLDAHAGLRSGEVDALLVDPADVAAVRAAVPAARALAAVDTGVPVVLLEAALLDDTRRAAIDGAVAGWAGSPRAIAAAARWFAPS